MSIDLSGLSGADNISSFNLSKIAENEEDSNDSIYDDEEGDTVSISEQARAMAQSSQSSSAVDVATGVTDEVAASTNNSSVKEKIDKLEQEIQDLKNDTELPEDEKQQQIMIKQQELMQLQQQQDQKSSSEILDGLAGSGGTRAEGMSSSLT